MASNLPPGVSEGMIPGNRPEDIAFDHILDGPLGEELATHAELIVKAGLEQKLKNLIGEELSQWVFCSLCETPVTKEEAFYGKFVYCSVRCEKADKGSHNG